MSAAWLTAFKGTIVSQPVPESDRTLHQYLTQVRIDRAKELLHTDAPVGNGFRWLTVCPPDQPDLEISLMEIKEGMMFKNGSSQQMRELVRKGTFGFGVFECNDINATYEELKAKGVEFTKLPKKEPYGYEAVFKDDSGNWYSLTQKREA